MRLFIAVPLPTEIQDRAAACLPPGLPGLRVVQPALLHLTLAFLGETPFARLPEVGAAAAEAARGQAAFPVTFDHAGRFPATGAPATLWLGVGEGAAALGGLAEVLRAALRGRGLALDERPFRPHLTLARLRRGTSPADRERILAALAALRIPPLGTVVERVTVVESVLSPRGPRYTERAAAPLPATDP